ncbi:MAG: hypothetical protein NVSMB53_16030 [Gemmatimonadaceae bacterium]
MIEIIGSTRGIALAGLVLTLAISACGKDESAENKRALTQREKDSILGNSLIPGAKAVKRTLVTADSASARQARIDSAQQNP